MGITPREKAPVFILGCPRSGTTLLYYHLLSAGNFAVYREETSVMNQIASRFGNPRVPKNREKAIDLWLKTIMFQATGLDAKSLRTRVLSECNNWGDFIRIVMEEVARAQNVERWAETTNDHLLYLPYIKKTIPDALIVHIIRDGRDVSLSLSKLGWVQGLPWNGKADIMLTGLFWAWYVKKGRECGKALGQDYIEVRFEDLVQRPQETLATLGRFIGQELDYDQIKKVGLGSVSKPNTSFGQGGEAAFNPVGRWKDQFSAPNLAKFEALIGDALQELGYSLGTPAGQLEKGLNWAWMRFFYPRLFGSKQWIRAHTRLTASLAHFPRDLLAD